MLFLTEGLFVRNETEKSPCPIINRMEELLEESKTIMDKETRALKKLIEETNMSFVQENGQRRLGPPKGMSPPPKGCEVFVGKIPRNCYVSELYNVFSKVGQIYDIRLMMDYNGANRGYCFVQYCSPTDAKTAIKDLNNFEIRPGAQKIGVVKSVNNCRLYIGGLPRDRTEHEIFEEIRKITEDVVKVIAYPSAENHTNNRGFAFVEYKSHKMAAKARRKMLPQKIPMFGKQVIVDWAEPEPEVDFETLQQVTNLYIRNLPPSFTEEFLYNYISKVFDGKIEKIKRIKHYAFINFENREDASKVKDILESSLLEGHAIEVSWAKPVNKSEQKKRKDAYKYSRNIGRPISRGSSGLLSRFNAAPSRNTEFEERPDSRAYCELPPPLPPCGYENEVLLREASMSRNYRDVKWMPAQYIDPLPPINEHNHFYSTPNIPNQAQHGSQFYDTICSDNSSMAFTGGQLQIRNTGRAFNGFGSMSYLNHQHIMHGI